MDFAYTFRARVARTRNLADIGTVELGAIQMTARRMVNKHASFLSLYQLLNARTHNEAYPNSYMIGLALGSSVRFGFGRNLFWDSVDPFV